MFNVVVIGTSCFDGMAASKRVMNIMRPLVDHGDIALSNLAYRRDIKQDLEKEGSLENIRYRVIGINSRNFLSVFSFVFRGIGFLRKSKSRDQKNIIYNYGSIDIKNFLFLVYGRLAGYKIILDIVEDNRFEKSVNWINRFRIKSSQYLLKNSWRLAQASIVISDHLHQRMLEITKGRIPLHLIPISVDLDKFPQTGAVEGPHDRKIFYGGSFGEKDGLKYLVDAFEQVCEKHGKIELVLTGGGHSSNMQKIDQQIAGLRHRDRIAFKGFLSSEDYYKLLNECDIFCMTRVNSKFANAGFPFKLGEFLASGKAVIATEVGDVPKYLINNQNALVIAPESVPELAAAISTLVENPEKIGELGKQARKTAEQYFDAKKISVQLLSIFESVFNRAHSFGRPGYKAL